MQSGARKEWKRLLGSFFAEGVNVAVVKNDEGQIEGYAVYRLGAPGNSGYGICIYNTSCSTWFA